MRLQPLRTLIVLVTLLLTASTVLAIPTASAQGATRDFGAESGFLASLNSQRASAGLSPLTLSASMTAAADGWTISMVNGSFLAHASDIVTGTPAGWTKVGENVGRGQSVSSLTSAFMASPSHRANIMDASYTHIGIAVYNHPSDGRMYTTHRFAALPGAAPAAPVIAAPTATPVPPTATPVPPTPVPPTPVPPTPVPTATAVPTPIPTPEPTATPVPPLVIPTAEPTPIPTPEPTATPVPPLVVPTAEPTPIPPTPEPTATAVPPLVAPTAEATTIPATPEPTATATTVNEASELTAPTQDAGFGDPPEQLAFVNAAAFEQDTAAKLASKTAKFGS